MNKKVFRLKKQLWSKLFKSLSVEFGLPAITSSMVLYFYKDEKIFELKFINSQCFFRVNSLGHTDKGGEDSFGKKHSLNIGNNNIKGFFKFLTTLGLEKAFISEEAINIRFTKSDNSNAEIVLNTPLGDLFIARGLGIENKHNKYLDQELSSGYIQRFFEKNTQREKIFDRLGLLNSKIIKYGNRHGIPLKSYDYYTIKDTLSSKSNDYQMYENIYKELFKVNFNNSTKSSIKNYFEPISIIIPAYNSEGTVLKTLYSIESQKISNIQKESLEVIIIDDGSKIRLFNVLKDCICKLSFPIRIIRLETNMGLSNARNIGVRVSKYSKILFIDSDIILPDNYLLEHSICLQLFPNCLFISMKKNIDRNNEIISDKRLLKGLKIPQIFDDKRILREFKRNEIWGDKIKTSSTVESLSETDLYKNFGYGRTISGYDLPSVVVGHNLSLSKEMFIRIGGFSNTFSGWGMEDTLFGAKFISAGGFVVPIMKTGVYHINHLPRSGSKKIMQRELDRNLKIYKKIIESNYE